MVSGQNIDQKRLAQINTRLQRVKVGNFHPSNANLYIGDLQGNQFEIILRDVRNTDKTKVSEISMYVYFNIEDREWDFELMSSFPLSESSKINIEEISAFEIFPNI